MTDFVVIDFESRSRVDLGSTNSYEYARHETTEVLCMAYAYEGCPVQLWKPGDLFPFDEWPNCKILAFNSEFEYSVWNFCCRRLYDWPKLAAEQVECLQARAAYAGLPRKLASLGGPLGLGTEAKDDQGHRNMLRLCKPLRAKKEGRLYVGGIFDDDPERHARNDRYCIQDVRTESIVHRLCPPLPPKEQELWVVNRKINERGVPVDVNMCRTAVHMVNREMERLSERLKTLTGGDVTTPNQLQRIKEHFEACDVNLPDMTEGTVNDVIDGKLGEIPEDVLEILNIRRLCRDAAVAKYSAMRNHINAQGRCQAAHVYYQAGPGRFAGIGCQFQNYRRLDEDALEDNIKLADRLSNNDSALYQELCDRAEGVIPTLGGIVRLAVCAKPGNMLIVSDWSAIEMRCLHWIAGDANTLQQIRDFDNGQGSDPYKMAAANIYQKSAADVTKAERQTGKVQILGCGFGTGAVTFSNFCKQYGIDMPLDRAQEIVQLYRRSFPLVKRLWYALSDAAVSAVKNRKRHQIGYVEYYMTGCTLNVRLPSGRKIKYYDATVVDGEYGPEVEATNPKGGGRRTIGMPTLVENIVQGVARDLLAEALLECRRRGLPVVLHVHDSIIIEVPEGEADHLENVLKYIMLENPLWSKGLPLAVDIGTSKRFAK